MVTDAKAVSNKRWDARQRRTVFLRPRLKLHHICLQQPGYQSLKQSAHGNVLVSIEVKNTGAREGDEVVQLYVHDLVSSVTTYEKVLRGFQRVHLKPGEIKTLTFTLTPEDLALWDRSMRFVVKPGSSK